MKKGVGLGLIIAGVLFIASLALRPQPSYAAGGSEIYTQKCAFCHGADGKGKPTWKTKGMPDFTDAAYQKSQTDQQIYDSIANGKKPMPAYKDKLSKEDIQALVQAIRKFEKK